MFTRVRCLVIPLLLLVLLLSPAPLLLAAEPGIPLELKGFDGFAEETLKEWKTPGVAVSIVKDGKTIYTKGFGVRDLKKKQPVTAETVFAIGSCSKAFTSMALGMLMERGLLHFDRPVRDYVSWFRMNNDYVTSHITLRDFLTHRSGLPRYDTLLAFNMPKSRLELAFRLRFLEFNKGFRTAYEYNNLLYISAGFVLEQVSGKSWEAFVKENILLPLSMSDTSLSVNDLKTMPDVALPHKEDKEELKEVPFYASTVMAPAGGINSNVRDLAKWITVHLNKGKYEGKELLSERTMAELQRPQVIASLMDRPDVSFLSYGLGWSVQIYRGNLLVSHDGEIDGFQSTVAFMPDKNLGVAVLANRSGDSFLPRIMALNALDRMLGLPELSWKEYYKDKVAKSREARDKMKKDKADQRKEGTRPSHDLAAYAGAYEHPAYGKLQVAEDKGALKLFHGLTPYALRHYHYESFEMGENSLLTVTFITGARGEVDAFSIPIEQTVKEILFTRVKEKK